MVMSSGADSKPMGPFGHPVGAGVFEFSEMDKGKKNEHNCYFKAVVLLPTVALLCEKNNKMTILLWKKKENIY